MKRSTHTYTFFSKNKNRGENGVRGKRKELCLLETESIKLLQTSQGVERLEARSRVGRKGGVSYTRENTSGATSQQDVCSQKGTRISV